MRLSPSALNLYDSCPRRFFHERILCDIDPTVTTDTSAADRGRDVHEQFEKAALGEQPWPESYPLVEEWYREVIQSYPTVAVERKLALNEDFKPTGFDFSDARLRGIADLILWDGAVGAMRVVDYKTGKRRMTGATLQMKFYALACLLHSDRVKTVTTDLYWVGLNTHDAKTYTRKDIPDLIAYFKVACARVENAVEFPARPGGLCKGFCPVSACEHFKPYVPEYSGPAFTFK